MNILLEALKELNKLDEKEELTREEIIANAQRAEELFLKEKENFLKTALNLPYGENANKIKGYIKSFDIQEERKELKERDPYTHLIKSNWADVLSNKLVCVRDYDGSEFETTLDEMTEKGFEFFKNSSLNYTFSPINLLGRWNALVGLFNSYKKKKAQADRLKPIKLPAKRKSFDIETFDPYNWGDQNEVGAAWAEISQHKDWQDWIIENTKSISARAPEIGGKLKKAKHYLGHDRVYPANTWGWSFAITFDKDKLDECPFKHLLSNNGKLCSVATVCALFRGPEFEKLFTSRDEGNEIEFEEEELSKN